MTKAVSGGLSSRLSDLGIVLPAPPTPLGAYVESSDAGNLLFLSGMLPVVDRKLAIVGRLGENLSVKEGQAAAHIAALNALAAAAPLTPRSGRRFENKVCPEPHIAPEMVTGT